MTMSGEDFQKSHVLSWWQKVYSDWEDATSSDRAFEVFGPDPLVGWKGRQPSISPYPRCQLPLNSRRLWCINKLPRY